MFIKKFLCILSVSTILVGTCALPSFATSANESSSKEIETQLTATTVRDLPDGGKEYVYNIDGIENVFPVPPENFNPLTATDEQLKEYHFQDKPTEPEALSQWKDVMSHYKKTAEPKLIKTNRKSKLQSSVSATIFNAPNWSGYVNEGQTWNDVVGAYTQPSMGSGSPANSYECSWVGLGGVNTRSLIQAGTGMDNYTNTYYAWYEYIDYSGTDPNNGMKKISLPIHPNDRIHIEVSHDSSSLYTQFNFANYTTGVYANPYIPQLSNNFFDSSTAEWIDERPQYGTNAYYPLMNYGTINWSSCFTKLTLYPNTYHNLRDYTYQPIYMYSNGNPTGNLLSMPSSLTSGTSFDDYFVSSQ